MPMCVVRHKKSILAQSKLETMTKKRRTKAERAVVQADVFGRIDFFPPKQEEEKKEKIIDFYKQLPSIAAYTKSFLDDNQ
ncbi:hypothetical protein PCI56_04400 [Plesiomonas shigelloides subsp. oncorhynchi]|nr:hypothetical protein [Plesiomonas shigelloides]